MKRALVIAALFAAASLAQSQTSFRTSVQYVTVDVVVTDKHDRPVSGLKKEDFEIIESDRPQAIADFQFVSIPAVMRKIAVDGPAQPDPDVSTNVASSPNSRLFAIIVDDQFLIEQDLVKIKRTLTDLVNLFSPDDEAALVFVSRSNFSVNFTTNHNRLMDRINHLKEVLGFGLDSLMHVDSPSEFGPVSKPYRFKGMVLQDSLTTFGNVARALGGSGHTRRAMFVVSSGWIIPAASDALEHENSVTGVSNVSDLAGQSLSGPASLFKAARLANVPVYTLDPRGNIEPEDAVRGGMGGTVTTLADMKLNTEARQNIRLQHDGLAMLAVNTGGRAVFNTQSMTKAAQEFVQENGSYYLLGYYPTPYSADGFFHEIRVRVKRDGLRVRARRGYEASSSKRSTAPINDPMQRAMTAGVNVSGLPLRVFAEPMAIVGDRMTVAVIAELAYPARADGSTQYDEHLQVRLLALDPDASVKGESSKNFRFTGRSPASGDTTLVINDVIDVPVQPLTLRVGVGSQELGKAGTVQVAVEMRVEKNIGMGGIFVGVEGTKPVAMQPDVFADVIPFQPVTTRAFSRADTLRLFGHVYVRSGVGDPSIAISVTGPSGANQVPATVQRSGGDLTMDTKLPLQGMAPGKYHLAITATLPGGRPLTRDVLFEVK